MTHRITNHSVKGFISLAERVRITLRRPSRLRNMLLVGMSATLLSTPPLHAVELPQACVSGACGFKPGTTSPITWVTSGSAAASVSGNTLTVNQSTENVTLNWASFNISADGKVIFSQPSTSSIALNRIFQQSPSQILGSISTQLNSDAGKTGGQVYLINPNGFVFGAGSSVNAAGILASTMTMTDDVFNKGLLSAIQGNNPALDATVDTSGATLANVVNGKIIVQHGAVMQTTKTGGRVMLAASEVNNAGELHADDGQIILAAGDKLYIAAANQNNDPLRGLYVEVGGDGVVTNDVAGLLSSKRGDISIVGMAINQNGRVSATTSVSANGSVHLLARRMDDIPAKAEANGVSVWKPSVAGRVTLGSQSTIDIGIDKDDALATAVDAQLQDKSDIQIAGKQIVMQGGASIIAHGGNVTMHAAADPNAPLQGVQQIDSDARLRIDAGANIDISGNSATRSVADNIVKVELRGTELADSPDQRNGALHGKTVTVDARVGTPLADVSGAIGSIGKTVAQRTSEGGKATFVSTGDIVAAHDAVINVSGGITTYTGAMVNTSQLITADGKTVDIANAKPDVTYIGVVSPTSTVKHDRWGVVESVGQQTGLHYEAGYTQGSSAGKVTFDAPTLIVDASLSGHATNGAYQRIYDSTGANGYALGGQLIIGENNINKDLNYRAGSVTLSAKSSNISVSDDVSISGIPLMMSTDYLRSGGFTRTEINSNETITVAQDADITLQAGSNLTLRAAQVNLNSSITAPAGVFDVNSQRTLTQNDGGGIHVSDNVQFNVSGQWINDTELANDVVPTATLLHNAGAVTLNATNPNGSLNIGNGVSFIADGGAWLNTSGVITGGVGGNVGLLSNGSQSSFRLGSEVNLSAYGVNGAKGGQFSLSAGRIQITPRNSWADAQVYDPAAPGSLWYMTIAPKLFRDYGFSTFNITATGGTLASNGDALQLVAGTQIDAVADTRLLSTIARDQHSGTDIHDFSSVETLPDYLRNVPATLNFSVKPNSDFAGLSALGALDIQQAAVITGDPGTKINLASVNGVIDIEGSMIAHGGSINARITAPTNFSQTPNDPNLAIIVGNTAVLDASGAFVSKPSDTNLLQGVIKDGGSVSLQADRGSVDIHKNATVNVSGTQALIDVQSLNSGAPYQRETLASNAGNIALSAAESIVIDGSLQAHAGVGTTGLANGGSLSLTMTRNNAQAEQSVYPETFSNNQRIVNLTKNQPAQGVATVNGTAIISVVQLQAAGIDDVQLKADNVIGIDGDVTLSLQRRLQIDAPALQVNDGTAKLTAGYVSMGSSLLASATAPASPGGGVLDINANNIDIVGSSSWLNLDRVNLVSSGDVRFVGKQLPSALAADVFAAADIHIQASRVYATTATQATINNSGFDITISQGSVSPGVPLSAASSLTFNANSIHQNGTLLAPFGTINLNANDIELGAGSYTSVSANGAVIPYGTTDSNGRTWLYSGVELTSLPSRTIALNGSNNVTIDRSATVDLSGGGDLYAREWIKGTGGTNDAFDFKLDPKTNNATSTLTNPGLFAIIPTLGTQLAPIDVANATVTAAQGLKVGDTVYLNSTGSLAAGFYTLLPANYSLLDGAYLVSAVPGFNAIQPNTNASLADGTPVVAGYRSFGASGIGGTSYSGFAVYPGTWGRSLAQYQDTTASAYFSSSTHRTVDAGQLSIATLNSLSAEGKIVSAASKGGRAASIDISATNLQIVGSVGQGSPGAVQLQDTVINGWKAGSLVLGGVRHDEGKSINVDADSVAIASNAHLTADEVVLVARDSVSIDAGSSVQSTSATSNKAVTLADASIVTLKGSGAANSALVAVSDLAPMQVMRDNTIPGNAIGEIDLAAGSSIATHGSLNIDAPNGGVLAATVAGSNANWTLSSSHLVLGDNSATGQLTINSKLFDSMQSASAVTLRSSGALDIGSFANGTTIALGSSASPLNSISLQAATLNNFSGEDVSFHAGTINLTGAGVSILNGNRGSASGLLSLSADNINVDNSSLLVNGFANVQLLADQQLKISDNGTVSVDGDLDVTSARITASAASNGGLIASGNVQLTAVPTTSTLDSLELGGGLTIQGNNITSNANIVMPSGVVNLNAVGLLTLGSTAVVDVAGVPVYAAGVRADSNGGTIHLSSGGNMSALAGSKLKVDGSSTASAGTIGVNAGGALDLQSTLSAATDGATGGSIVVNAHGVTDFAKLNKSVQQSGFTQQQKISVAQGDLQLSSEDSISAHDVQWVTDSGHIQINGVISAASTDQRGNIRLYGADGVTVTGELHADGDVTTGRGGIIELGVSTDTANHAGAAINIANSVITADGYEQGRLRLRAPVINGNNVNISALPTDITKLNQIVVEGVSVLPDVANVNWTTVKNNATTTYAALAGNTSLRTRLTTDSRVILSPGVELTNSGDINLGAVDLTTWKINGGATPVALTVRAGGNININGVVSDGFVSSGTGTKKYLSATDLPSATIRLVAGSNVTNVDPLSVGNGNGNILLNSNAIVRTGGDLSLVAARDITFNVGTSVYTGGKNASPQLVTTSTGAGSSFLSNGGQLLIDAGHDVNGYAVTQSATAWQPRTTCGNLDSCAQATIFWGTDIREFKWNAGALGGGDVVVSVGHDLNQLSAAVADSALIDTGRTNVTHYGGGALVLRAGDTINSGMIYAGRYSADVSAENAIVDAIWNSSSIPVGLFVVMGDARVNVNARNGISLASVVNPTIMEMASGATRKSYYYTYGATAALSLASAGGNIDIHQGDENYVQPFISNANKDGVRKLIVAPNVSIAALGGDVNGFGSQMIMYPADTGQLSIFAEKNVNALKVSMSDAGTVGLYTPFSPNFSSTGSAGAIDTSFGVAGRAPSARHMGDTDPASIVAGNDINGSLFNVAKSMRIYAGRDISDLNFYGQNLNASDISEVVAGRDIIYSAQSGVISVGGPGRLDVIAGHNIDLGTAFGIESTGRLNNPNIPDTEGASIDLMAGMNAGWNVAKFVDTIVAKSKPWSKELMNYVAQQTGNSSATLDEAIAAFKLFSPDRQRPFVLNTFFTELVASGREATAPGSHTGYARGYAAIDALFPDSRSDNNPYHGDISMLFSRVYTLSGGAINMLAPGGTLDVGVAARPQSTTVNKPPGQLGIVTQQGGNIDIFTRGDVSVNSSRIFTLGGGDIAIWSTLGNIDAGKGAKSSLSIPPPATTIDDQGNVTLVLTGAVAGSGIRTIQSNPDTKRGDTDLMTPVGYVDAGDAGIGASGNINIAAREVRGADNVNFGGNANGVPAATSGLGVSLSSAANAGGSSDKTASGSGNDGDRNAQQQKAPIAQAALSWLEVFVTGLGEENCKQDDVECLKRQK